MIPLYKPYMPELPLLYDILYSGQLAYGKYGKELESKLSSFIGVNQVTLVNSFNSAILVALTTLGLKPNDEVISSPMACLASNQPVITMGIKLVWADVNPTSGTLDPESVKQKISLKTKAILHNHFCGYPGYIDEINMIGKEYGIPVIDDAIEAFGSIYRNEKIGNNETDITIFSFQAVRLPTTIDGGAIVFKDKSLYERSLLVRDSGIDRKYFRDNIGEINLNYDISVPGFGATMSEVNSYIGLQQMNDIENLLSKQRVNAEKWNKWLSSKNFEYKPLNKRKEIIPNYWVYGILSENKIDAIRKLRSMGFYASGVHVPNNYYSIFGKQDKLTGVDEFYSKFVAVPSGWWLPKNLSIK